MKTKHSNSTIHRQSLLIAVALCYTLAGCATTDPAVLAKRKSEGDALVAQTWYQSAQTVDQLNHSFEGDSTLRFSADGTGTISSRRFGYTNPKSVFHAGGKATQGCGAYTGVVTWPIEWEALGDGKIQLECAGDPTSTGSDYSNRAAVPLESATRTGNTLVVHYSSGANATFQAVAANDSRLNPSASESSRRVASWAGRGPGLLAKTAAQQPVNTNVAQGTNGGMGLIQSPMMNTPMMTNPMMPTNYAAPQPMRYWAPGGYPAVNAALMNNLGRH